MASSSGGGGGGGGGVPPGFRFHPTDEELLHYYLKKKISFQKFDMEVIREVDLNKIEPWDLQERCKIGSTPQNEWYFFSHKDRKYPTGSRTNRATNAGFWKATGRDKCIRNSFKKIGMRKTLVFYRGRAPHGQKTDWIMHEYRLEDTDHQDPLNPTSSSEDGWVICRVFKKRNLFKVGGNEGSGASVEDEMNNTGLQPRSSFSHNSSRGNHHHQYQLLHQQQQQQQSFDLGLNYSHLPQHNYPHLHAQNFIPNHKPLGYDHFSHLVPSDSPLVVKQLMSSARECDSGGGSCDNLGYEHGLEVGTCEPSQAMVAPNGRDESLNEWGMIDHRIVSTSHLGGGHQDSSSKGVATFDENSSVAAASSSMHPMNQLSLRGEMDFWGYGK